MTRADIGYDDIRFGSSPDAQKLKACYLSHIHCATTLTSCIAYWLTYPVCADAFAMWCPVLTEHMLLTGQPVLTRVHGSRASWIRDAVVSYPTCPCNSRGMSPKLTDRSVLPGCGARCHSLLGKHRPPVTICFHICPAMLGADIQHDARYFANDLVRMIQHR